MIKTILNKFRQTAVVVAGLALLSTIGLTSTATALGPTQASSSSSVSLPRTISIDQK